MSDILQNPEVGCLVLLALFGDLVMGREALPDPVEMCKPKRQDKSGTIDIKAVLAEDDEFQRALAWMEAELAEALGAEKANGWRAARATGWVITAGR